MRYAIGAALLAALSIPASAEGHSLACATREAAQEVFDRFAEVPVFTGVTGEGDRVLLHLNPETMTWTLSLQPADARARICPLAAGDGGSLEPLRLPEY